MATESLAFELKLVDSVTGVAKRQASAVKQIETSANKAQTALGKQFEKIGFAAARAAQKQEQAFAQSWAKIGMAAQRAQERQKKEHERHAEKMKEHSFLGGISEGVGFGKLTSAAFLGSALAEGAFKIGETLVEAAHKVVEVITDGVKDAFKAAGKEQTQRIGEKISLGAGAGEFREDVERFAGKTGFTSSEIRGLMLPSRNAGMSQAATRQSLATASDIAAGRGKGGSIEEVGSIMEQFQHIYTKKGIGKKQLVELLGNVGSTIPDFYKSLGKQMHVSAKDAEKMSEEGKLDPQLLINMITQAQNKKQGGIAGTGALEYSKSFEAHWHKINELPDEFYRKLVDSPGFARANEALGGLLEKLDPDGPAGMRIQAAISDMFDKITGYIGDPEETADALASGIESAIRLTKDLVSTAKEVADAFLPSLRTIEDMTFALRLAIATTKGEDAVAKVNNEYANVVEGRGLRLLKKFQEENFNKSDVGKLYDQTGFNPVLMAAQAKPSSGAAPVEIKMENHFHGEVKDPEDHGRKMARGARTEMERARQKGGGH